MTTAVLNMRAERKWRWKFRLTMNQALKPHIPRVCVNCGREKRLILHHLNGNFWDVVYLCTPCHRALHWLETDKAKRINGLPHNKEM